MPVFSTDNGVFSLDGKPMTILSGAIHYFRTHPDQWRDRLEKLKDCGFNTVETYTPWNLHEKTPGCFDFTGMLDIGRFLDTAAEVGLYAIVRPGPFICAEWEFGGLPADLLADGDIRLALCRRHHRSNELGQRGPHRNDREPDDTLGHARLARNVRNNHRSIVNLGNFRITKDSPWVRRQIRPKFFPL